jgi:NitT/TauT family transport system substrate-binding protein
MKKNLLVLMLMMLTTVLIAAGCAKDETPQSLKIGVMSDIGAAPYIIAKENGYFEALGLDVEITVFKSATDRDTAMQTGNLDGAMADMLTIMFYNDAAFDAKITSQTYGSYVMVSTPALDKSGVEALDKIEVGISANTVIDFVTDQIAADAGILEKVSTVAIPQMPVRLEMLGAGELDAATLPEPLASAAVLNGGEAIMGTLDLGLQPGIFIMTEAAIDEKSDAIEKLYEGYNQAVDYLNNTDQNDYIQLLIDQLGFPPSLAESFDFPELSKAQVADEVTFGTVQSWMKDRALTTSDFSFSELSTDQFIK